MFRAKRVKHILGQRFAIAMLNVDDADIFAQECILFVVGDPGLQSTAFRRHHQDDVLGANAVIFLDMRGHLYMPSASLKCTQVIYPLHAALQAFGHAGFAWLVSAKRIEAQFCGDFRVQIAALLHQVIVFSV